MPNKIQQATDIKMRETKWHLQNELKPSWKVLEFSGNAVNDLKHSTSHISIVQKRFTISDWNTSQSLSRRHTVVNMLGMNENV